MTKSSKYTLIHAPAEDAPVESNSQDLVSLCLVAHESPKWVRKQTPPPYHYCLTQFDQIGDLPTHSSLPPTAHSRSYEDYVLTSISHSLSLQVSKSIFAEAFRILKPGGSFTMLDLDKENLENLLENPFVAAIYKRTEPYMEEFLKLDPKTDLKEAGFEITEVDNASRSHRVYVARKPESVEVFA